MLRAIILAALVPGASLAQGVVLDFAPRVGVAVTPAYPGASEYELGPDLGFSLGRAQLGGSLGFGSGYERQLGFGFKPSIGFIGERDSSEYDEIDGLGDVDAALELGVGGVFRGEAYQVFGDLRRGFGGHEGVVLDIGADYVARPTRRLTITAGPRATFADDTYASTYFDVSAAESAVSGLGAYDADGGIVSAGVEAVATYRLGDDWAVEGGVTYDRLIGDAGDSSIVEAGSEDQFGLRLGISRRIRLGF